MIEQYGRSIPAGFLLHMTKFEPPPAGDISDALLLAWGRLTKKIRGEGEVSATTFGVSHGDGDLAFAHWLLERASAINLRVCCR